MVYCEEAVGSGKESTQVNKTRARGAVFLTKQKPFPSVPQEAVEWPRVLDCNQKKSFGILTGKDYT